MWRAKPPGSEEARGTPPGATTARRREDRKRPKFFLHGPIKNTRTVVRRTDPLLCHAFTSDRKEGNRFDHPGLFMVKVNGRLLCMGTLWDTRGWGRASPAFPEGRARRAAVSPGRACRSPSAISGCRQPSVFEAGGHVHVDLLPGPGVFPSLRAANPRGVCMTCMTVKTSPNTHSPKGE